MSVTIDDLRQIASSVDNATSLLEPAVKKLLAQLPKGSKKRHSTCSWQSSPAC